MPSQRTHHSRITYEFPGDFPERLERFRWESSLTWAELSRSLGTHPHIVRRWRHQGVRPNTRHVMALLELARGFGLGYLFVAGDGWRNGMGRHDGGRWRRNKCQPARQDPTGRWSVSMPVHALPTLLRKGFWPKRMSDLVILLTRKSD